MDAKERIAWRILKPKSEKMVGLGRLYHLVVENTFLTFALMKISSLLILFLSLYTADVALGQHELQIMTFNVRYDNASDPLLWADRKDEVASVMRYSQIVGVQEALYHQATDIAERLPQYKWVGVGRDDGALAGEFCPIYYDTTALHLRHFETLWLSPDYKKVGSRGWDAHLPRIATIAIFQHIQTNKTLRIINTHFSHVGDSARVNAARIIRSFAVNAPEDFTFVMGDFNEVEGMPAYTLLNAPPLADTYYTSRQRCRTSFSTFSTFETNQMTQDRIDYIFSNVPVEWICIEEVIKWGYYISDHFPVFISFRL
ncbi:MAG: hypothetical protein GC193_11855 [Cryomorphaceae bacterium]|nr:hypothetical protein [Cryomorphaceae bacterium]